MKFEGVVCLRIQHLHYPPPPFPEHMEVVWDTRPNQRVRSQYLDNLVEIRIVKTVTQAARCVSGSEEVL